MDTRKKLNDFSRKIDYIKINTKEFEELSEPTKYAKNIIVTRGDKGAEWINRGLFYPTKPVHNPIVCGAGDSFMAALVLNFIQTNDIPESIKFANAAARVRVSKNEQTVTLGEIPQNWRES
jgi:sugar/nucleoside kinase (ribokinase family)